MAFARRDFPQRITIEVTNRCNISCTFCPRRHIDMRLGFMERPLFTKIIDEAAGHTPVTTPLFFRGEPLLHPELPAFLSYAKLKGMGPVQLATNALLLDEAMGSALISAGLDFLSVSLDTNDGALYEASRLGGDFNASKANLLAFCAKCAHLRARGVQTPEIQVSTVDTRAYRAGLEDFTAFWRERADIVRVYEEHSADSSFGSLQSPRPDTERRPCKKVYTDMVIYWDGTAALCNHDWDNTLGLGSALESSVYDIWNSGAYARVREMHESGAFADNIVCKSCDHWRAYYLPEGVLGRVYKRCFS